MSESTPWPGRFPEIRVICTGRRRRHRLEEIDVLTDYRTADPPGRIRGSYRTARVSRSGRQVIRDRPDPISSIHEDGSFTFTWSCRLCPSDRPGHVRTVRRCEETLGAELDQFYVEFPSGSPLDISYMD